jgi:hypothetical protein
MTLALNARVRLTPEVRENQPDLAHAIGTVVDIGGGAVKVRWTHAECWHKPEDIALDESGVAMPTQNPILVG